MQYSIVNYSNIDLGHRIDAEYFQPTYLHIEEKLVENQAIPLRNFFLLPAVPFILLRYTSMQLMVYHLSDVLTVSHILSLHQDKAHYLKKYRENLPMNIKTSRGCQKGKSS